jgi:hypothetical protein
MRPSSVRDEAVLRSKERRHERSHLLDAVIRVAQPLNVLALPLLIVQGKQVRRRMPRLPAAQGPIEGVCPGKEPVLRLTVLGDSALSKIDLVTF